MISKKKGIVTTMVKIISIFGYLAYFFLALSMRSTAMAEMGNQEENAGLFARKFGIDLEIPELELLCAILAVYAVIAAVALLIKLSHAALGSGFCGALNMLFDLLFCVIHGIILYCFATKELSATGGACAYMAALFVVSLIALFSNGASLSSPSAKK